MRILLLFLRKELLQIKRDRKLLPLLIIAPIIQLLILGYAATFDVKKIPLLLIDYDKSVYSKDLIDSFINSGYFVVKEKAENLKRVDALFENGLVGVAIIIPRGFSKAIVSGRKTEISILYDGTDIITSSVAMGYSNLIINKFANSAIKVSKNVSMHNIKAELRIWYNQELKTVYFMVPAIFALLLTIVTLAIGSMSLVKEKELGTIEQLAVTPMRAYHIIAGKMSPFVLIAMLDVALVTLVATKLFEVPLRGSLFDLFLASFIFLLSSLGLGLLVSILVSTQQQAMMMAIFIFFLPSILLSGFIFPIENMPKWIQPISYILPVTYFIEILRGIFLKGASINDIYINYIALMLIGIFIFSVSIFKFNNRWQK